MTISSRPHLGNLLIFLMILLSQDSFCQHFLNLDFEYGVETDQPRKWSIEGDGERYFTRLDNQVAKRGEKSLFVQQTNAGLFIFLRIPAKEVIGKSIKVSGYIKVNSGDSLNANWVIAQPGGALLCSSKSATPKSNDWQELSAACVIPASYPSDRVLLALISSGTGEFHLDDVSIFIGDKYYGNDKPDFREPNQYEISNLNALASPISIIGSNYKIDKPMQFKNMIGHSKLVGIGENSHGSSSIYKFKLSLIQFLVKKMGFTIFALEMPVAEADNINRFIQDNEVEKETIINNLSYKSWQINEMLDIINWIKFYNKKAKIKVSFRGFDMQNAELALKNVELFTNKYAPEIEHHVHVLLKINDSIKSDLKNGVLAYKIADSIYNELKDKTGFNSKTPTHPDLQVTKHYLRVYMQSLALKYKLDSSKSRDEYMAENIDWILKNATKGTKIIISADNTHISEASAKMGSYLKIIFQNDYIAMAGTFNTGTYSAYGPMKYYPLHNSYPGTA